MPSKRSKSCMLIFWSMEEHKKKSKSAEWRQQVQVVSQCATNCNAYENFNMGEETGTNMLTLKEFFQLPLCDVLREVANKQLLTVGVSGPSPHTVGAPSIDAVGITVTVDATRTVLISVCDSVPRWPGNETLAIKQKKTMPMKSGAIHCSYVCPSSSELAVFRPHGVFRLNPQFTEQTRLLLLLIDLCFCYIFHVTFLYES